MSHWLLWFERRWPASYLSHLDTARALQRTFARAGIGLALSEGFRPKVRFSLPLPLPVGAAGLRELAVVEVTDGAPNALQMCVARPHPQVTLARYACEVHGAAEALAAATAWYAEQEEVTVERVSPKGRRTLDLAKYVQDLAAHAVPCGARISFAVRHGADGAARPQEVVDLLAGRAGCAPVMHRLTRIAVSYEGLPRDMVSGGEE